MFRIFKCRSTEILSQLDLDPHILLGKGDILFILENMALGFLFYPYYNTISVGHCLILCSSFLQLSVVILLMPIFTDLFQSSCQFETSNEYEQICTSEERQAFNEKLDEVRIFFWWCTGMALVMKAYTSIFFRYKIGYIWMVKMLLLQNFKNALTC